MTLEQGSLCVAGFYMLDFLMRLFSLAPPKPKQYPVMTIEMIESDGQPINSTQAIKHFKQFMLKTGYLDKMELADHAGYFADEMKEHGKYLAEELAAQKEGASDLVAEAKYAVAALKRALAKASTEADRTALAEELADAEEELKEQQRGIVEAQEALTAFKSDKRLFLAEYVNRQLQRN